MVVHYILEVMDEQSSRTPASALITVPLSVVVWSSIPRGSTLSSRTAISLKTTFGGAGICQMEGQLEMEGCNIYRNRCLGGTSSPPMGDGGGILVLGGTGTIESCNIFDNEAGTDGGGLASRGGVITLKGETRIWRNIANRGQNVYVTGATYFSLPLAPGHWLPNSKCTWSIVKPATQNNLIGITVTMWKLAQQLQILRGQVAH